MSMNKIRLFFLLLVSVVSIVGLILFSSFNTSPPEQIIDQISEFKVTKISGNGKVYVDKKPIEGDQITNTTARSLEITQTLHQDQMYIKTDQHTSFQFYCFGMSFTVLPSSYLYFRPQTKEFCFYSGRIYWKREGDNTKVDISIQEPQNLMTLSNWGRLEAINNSVEIWSYDGNLKVTYSGRDYSLKSRQLLVVPPQSQQARNQKPPEIIDVLPAPAKLDPEFISIQLNEPQDSVVKLDWPVVKGNPEYIIRVYSSQLRENLLLEKRVQNSNFALDLLQFEERDFFWEVLPVDTQSKREGLPSNMGRMKLVGALLTKKNVQKPPELYLDSLTVNGGIVLMEGTADTNAKLFINGENIVIDRDGRFMHPITYKDIGPKKIQLKLISPLGVETLIERNVFIYSL